MSELLRERVANRINELGLKVANVDKTGKLTPGYTRDLLEGRKDQPRLGGLKKLAFALDCDVEYLLLAQKTPRKGEIGFDLSGLVEAGVWREPSAGVSKMERVAVEFDPRHPSHLQKVYRVVGEHAAEFGIQNHAYIQVVMADKDTSSDDVWVGNRKIGDGDIVLVSRVGENGTSELTVRQVRSAGDGVKLFGLSSSGERTELDPHDGHVEIIGLVIRTFSLFW